MEKSAVKWAIHKTGTAQFGYLCSFEEEAEHMLLDMKKDIINMPVDELNRYKVVKVTLIWDE